jgi:phospholipid transport system transporter-binding protein
VSTAALVDRGQARWSLEGVLDFESVAPLVPQGERMLCAAAPLDLDLSAVREANSAGLALLLEWAEMARSREKVLRLHNLPDSLKRLAALANVSHLLPLADAQSGDGEHRAAQSA